MLKKHVFITVVLIFILLCPFIHAQNGLKIGWKLGGNLAWNYCNSIQSAFDTNVKIIEKQFGWSLGMFAVKPWLGADGIQTELLVSRHVSKSVQASRYQTWELTYVSVPILYQKNLMVKENGCRNFVFAGLVPGILIDSRYNNQISGFVENHEIKAANLFDLGITIGFGHISSEGITLDLRYQLGLLNVAEGDAKNDALSLCLGFIVR